jgi:hypothetical protein
MEEQVPRDQAMAEKCVIHNRNRLTAVAEANGSHGFGPNGWGRRDPSTLPFRSHDRHRTEIE